MTEERKPFERQYSEQHSPKEYRDRFQVEFSREERDLFMQGQKLIEQSKDATALKQLAFLGLYAISNQGKEKDYFRKVLLKNIRNNLRLGIDVQAEILDKFQQRILKFGGKL